jgi:hypothetical protein
MPQQRHPLLDREIVDIVVEGDDVERLVGCPVADVADFYPYPVLRALSAPA